ncbi:hypothetical protein LN042_03680 [Kitasatospora sp. RB6PN24]|uniref:hypothetical protein n=1 Tax=Kitasatospora humi TaxID=2893891 RepID=UPI001E631330|nr:hypothetical protein [Kitasatospora humi]MCC9306217.1 hypothetical protein [Kitasatospora humi]
MSRSLLLAAGAASLALLGVAPQAAVAQPVTVRSAADAQPVCAGGLQAGLATTVCATVSGDTVSVTGQIALAGPPSDPTGTGTGGGPQPRLLDVQLAADAVGGANLATAAQSVPFTASTVALTPLDTSAPCGSTVHASLAVSAYPWAPAPVAVNVPVAC